MPQITRPQVYRVVRELLLKERFGPEELLGWSADVQDAAKEPDVATRNAALPLVATLPAHLPNLSL